MGIVSPDTSPPERPRRRHWVLARLRGLLWLLARPVRRSPSHRALVVQPYPGFGSPERVFVMGRVFRQPTSFDPEQPLARDLLDVGRRLLRRGVGNVTVRAGLHGSEAVTQTDADGYFHFDLPVRDREANGRGGWHDVSLELVGAAASRATARVFLYPPGSR
ncbi:MAG: hypothetical protein ACOCYE_08050, partial [Pseudomonadota bacterium]